jgi:hypothetical protein
MSPDHRTQSAHVHCFSIITQRDNMPNVDKVRATERMSEGGCQWGRLGDKEWDGRPASISKRADPRDYRKPCGHLTNCPLPLSTHTRTPVQRSHSGALSLPSLIQILWKEAGLDFRNPAISSARSVCSSAPSTNPCFTAFYTVCKHAMLSTTGKEPHTNQTTKTIS